MRLRSDQMRAVLAVAARGVLASFAAIARFVAIYPTNAYRPEAHYMRGPGPKWRAKHAPPSAT
jgi:hypothetical protein